MINTIFMLDKNIIALINDQLQLLSNPDNLKKPLGKSKINMLQFLKRHDKNKYGFSPITSIIEGRSRQREDEPKTQNSINYDTKNLESFFSYAKTDTYFLKSKIANTASIFSKHNFLYYEKKYKEILKYYYQNLDKYRIKGDIQNNKINEFSFNILNFSESKELPIRSPIIQIILMDINKIKIHNNLNPKNKNKKKEPTDTLRPSKKFKNLDEKIHNVYSDLSIPNLLASLNYAKNKTIEKKDLKISFLTLDKALEAYIQLFELKIKSKKIIKNRLNAEDSLVELYIKDINVSKSLDNVYKKWEDTKLEHVV